MTWEDVDVVGSHVEKDVEGVGLHVEEDVEGVGSPVEEHVVGSLFFSSIFSFSLFMRVSYKFLPCSTLLGSLATFCHVLSMFYFKQKGKD